jgi:enamine deaminase RidA (YjgF/YER057c/UK114 family)
MNDSQFVTIGGQVVLVSGTTAYDPAGDQQAIADAQQAIAQAQARIDAYNAYIAANPVQSQQQPS